MKRVAGSAKSDAADVVFSGRAQAAPSQPGETGATADRTVDYHAGKMDKNGTLTHMT
jgi:hypothetical protein